MLWFGRKKKTEIAEREVSPEEREQQNRGSVQTGAGYAAAETARTMTQKASETFAKPDTYTGNRNLYDSGTAKVAAKRKLFQSGQEVIDPYTGQHLVLTKSEAKQLYGEKWTEHLAESDHVKPLEQIYADTRNNVWNTTEDIRNAANSEDNIRVASRKFNNPKRSRTNAEYMEDAEYLQNKGVSVTAEGRQQALRDGELAEQSINRSLAGASVRNMVETGHEAGLAGAQNAGGMALTMSGINNLVAVVKGEKTGEEAVADTIKDGGKAAVAGYAMSGGLTVAAHSLSGSSSEFLQALGNSNVPGKVITAVVVTADTLKRWNDGEITTQQCMLEIGEKGLNMATMGYSMAVGQALIPIPIVGGAVGALVGSAMTSTYYHNLITQLQVKEMEHQERLQIISECRAAAAQEKAYREELEKYLEAYFQDYRNCFNSALNVLQFAWQTGDAEGMIAGANAITRKLGGTVNYDTMEEFERFMEDDSTEYL